MRDCKNQYQYGTECVKDYDELQFRKNEFGLKDFDSFLVHDNCSEFGPDIDCLAHQQDEAIKYLERCLLSSELRIRYDISSEPFLSYSKLALSYFIQNNVIFEPDIISGYKSRIFTLALSESKLKETKRKNKPKLISITIKRGSLKEALSDNDLALLLWTESPYTRELRDNASEIVLKAKNLEFNKLAPDQLFLEDLF